MKKFDFKLQKLLEIRQDKEEQEKIELGKASGAYQFEVNKKVKILDRLSIFRKDSLKAKLISMFQDSGIMINLYGIPIL